MILVFDGQGNGITAENFAGKLLGNTSEGRLLLGWARLPGVKFNPPLLSSLSPKFEFTGDGLEAYVEVQNFGQAASPKSTVTVLVDDEPLASGQVRALKPFERSMVRLICSKRLPDGSKQDVTVRLKSEGLPTENFHQRVTLPRN